MKHRITIYDKVDSTRIFDIHLSGIFSGVFYFPLYYIYIEESSFLTLLYLISTFIIPLVAILMLGWSSDYTCYSVERGKMTVVSKKRNGVVVKK